MKTDSPGARNRLAAVDFMNTDKFSVPLLMELGDMAVFYCSAEYAAKRKETVEKLNLAGVAVVIGDYDRALQHRYFLIDQWNRKTKEELKGGDPGDVKIRLQRKMAEKGVRCLAYSHGVDSGPNPDRVSGSDFFLCSSELLLLDSVGAGKYICDHQGRPIMGKMASGTECIVGGLFHFPQETLDLKKRGQASLQKELAEKLQVEFTPGLPVLLYMVPTHNDPEATDRGLKRLSKYANIIIRNLHFGESRPLHEASSVTGPNIFRLTREQVADGDLYSLMRMAADIVMVGLMSGSFISSLMLGLPTIVCITKTMMSASPIQPFNYTVFLRSAHIPYIRASHGLAPIDIEATDVLAERISDAAYWERYGREIKTLQDVIFGRYYVGDEAARQSAAFIKRALAVGSFAPPSLPLGGLMLNGPLWHLAGLCPVTL